MLTLGEKLSISPPMSRRVAQIVPHPEISEATRQWLSGWAHAMQMLQDRPPELAKAARPLKMLPAKPSRSRIWLEAKAARLAEMTADRPPEEPWRPSEPQLEEGRYYEPAEPHKSTEEQLRYAIRAYGRTGAAHAHWYLGSKAFEAIPTLGEGWHWAWLCQQPVERLPWIADRLAYRIGRKEDFRPREARRLIKDTHGGGQYMRNMTQVPYKFEEPHNVRAILCSELKGRVAGYDYWVDDLTHIRLTSGDWRRLIGHALKKMEGGKLRYSLQNYLKHIAYDESQRYTSSSTVEQEPNGD